MSDEQNHDPEESKTDTGELEKKLKECEEDKVKVTENLEREYQSTDVELRDFVQETESEQKRFETAKDEISSHLSKFKQETRKFVESSEELLGKNFDKFTTIISSIVRWFRFSIVFFSAAFLIVYFFLYNQDFGKQAVFSLYGLNFNEQAIVTVGSLSVAVLVLFVIVHLGSRSIKKKIENAKEDSNQNILDIQGKRPDISQDILGTGNFFGGIIKRFPIFDSRMKDIVKYSREFFPVADKLYAIMERRNLQIQFRKSLKNALNMYGLFKDPTHDLITTIESFSTPSNSKLDWVAEASQKVSFAFAGSGVTIDSRIIKVMYYDYDNSNDLSDAWEEVVTDDELLKQFAYLLLSRTMQINVSGSYDAFVELLKKPGTFKLSEFQRKYYDFFVEFKRRKTHMKTAAGQIGFDSEEVESTIDTFFPSTLNKETWDEELAKQVCQQLSFDFRYLLLFYYNRIGYDTDGIRTWNDIRYNDHLFVEFIKKLDSKNLLRIPEPYREHKDMPTFKKISLEMPEFDFYKFNELVHSKFKAIDDAKDKMINVLEDINPKWSSAEFRDNLSSFVPPSDDIVADIANHVGEKLDQDSDLLLLFYGTKYDQSLAEKHYKKIIGTKTQKLSEFLIGNELIKIEKNDNREKNVKNLSSILKPDDKFDLIKIQSTYQQYAHLLEISTRMIQFLHEEEIIKTEKLDFDELIKIVPSPHKERLENIQAISYYLIKSNDDFSNDALDAISKACSCLSLYVLEDVSAKGACEAAQRSSLASEILYYNMVTKEERILMKGKHSLKNVIKDVLTKTDISYDYMADFKMGLADGYLYGSRKEMMRHKMDNVEEQLEKISEIKEELEEMEDSVRTVLNTEFDAYPGFLEYAIQSHLIQAYIITTRSKGPALTQILDSPIIHDAAKEVMGNLNLDRFLIIGRPQKDLSLGSHTRIGIVPFDTSFEEFSEKFQTIYDLAVEKFLKENSTYDKSDFQLNIFRFLSSPATFKRIRFPENLSSKQDSESDDPIRIIEKLIKERFSAHENLSIIMTFSTKESSIVAKDILTKAFDGKTLYSFIQKELPTLMPEYQNIEKIMKDPTFDAKIYQSFKLEKFSELASAIHNARKSSDDEHMIVSISDKISKIVAEEDTEIKQEDLKQLSKLLYNKLIKFGKVLSS